MEGMREALGGGGKPGGVAGGGAEKTKVLERQRKGLNHTADEISR